MAPASANILICPAKGSTKSKFAFIDCVHMTTDEYFQDPPTSYQDLQGLHIKTLFVLIS